MEEPPAQLCLSRRPGGILGLGRDRVDLTLICLRLAVLILTAAKSLGGKASEDQWDPRVIGAVAVIYLLLSMSVELLVNKRWKTSALAASDLVVGSLLYAFHPDATLSFLPALGVVEAFRTNPAFGGGAAAVALLLLAQLGSLSHGGTDWVLGHLVVQVAVVSFASGAGFLAWSLQRVAGPAGTFEHLLSTTLFPARASLEEVVERVLDLMDPLFGAERAVVYLHHEDDDKPPRMRAVGKKSEGFEDFQLDQRSSVLVSVLNDREGRLLGPVTKGTEQVIPDGLLGSGMVAPLIVEGRPVGACLITHATPEKYRASDLERFKLVATQLATSLGRIELQQPGGGLAKNDAVTGLFTHAYFQDHLGRAISKAKYQNGTVALMILNVDFFKRVNDRYGHSQGDSLLRQVAGVVRSTVRPEDTVCRFGADTFAVTMPDTNRANGAIAGERLRQAIEQNEFVVGNEIIALTISAGVAAFPEDVETKKELIDKAEEARFEATQRGRNKVCSAGDS